jgi:hypothetical protein
VMFVGAPDQRRQLIAEHQRLAGDSGSPIRACPIKGDTAVDPAVPRVVASWRPAGAGSAARRSPVVTPRDQWQSSDKSLSRVSHRSVGGVGRLVVDRV